MGYKEVGESCARGAARLAGGSHEGVSVEEVKDAAIVPQAGPGGLFDPVRQAVFLQRMADKPIVGRAARAAGVTVGCVYAFRKRSAAFAAAWDEALVAGVDQLENRAIDRAMDKSDKLMELLLKGMRPETYREKVDAAAAMRVNIVVDLVEAGPGIVDAEDVTTLEDSTVPSLEDSTVPGNEGVTKDVYSLTPNPLPALPESSETPAL